MRIYPITLLTVLFSALVLAPGANAYAQNKVKTETIQVAPVDETEGDTGTEGTSEEPAADTSEDDAAAALPQVLYDLSLLPEPVATTRKRIIEAAQSGDLERMRTVLEMNELPPTVSFGGEVDPIEFWKTAGGDPEGREILAIMIEILESGYVHLDEGSPQEIYVWPYFYALPLSDLTPSQEVELYKLITPQDRQGMEEFGAYVFYRLGIGPDGTWHFFVAGD